MGISTRLLSDAEVAFPELICLLCQDLLHEPVQVFCGEDHVFCKDCLDIYIYRTGRLERKPDGGQDQDLGTKAVYMTCPGCEHASIPAEPLDINTFRSSKFVTRLVSALNMRCPSTVVRSCQWVGPLRDMDRHYEECTFSAAQPCPHKPVGCAFTGTLSDMTTHLQSCEFCCQKSRAHTSGDSASNNSTPPNTIPHQACAGNVTVSTEADTSTRSHRFQEPLSPPQSSPVILDMDHEPFEDDVGIESLQQEIESLEQETENQDYSIVHTPLSHSHLHGIKEQHNVDTNKRLCRKAKPGLDQEADPDEDGYSELFEDMEISDIIDPPSLSSSTQCELLEARRFRYGSGIASGSMVPPQSGSLIGPIRIKSPTSSCVLVRPVDDCQSTKERNVVSRDTVIDPYPFRSQSFEWTREPHDSICPMADEIMGLDNGRRLSLEEDQLKYTTQQDISEVDSNSLNNSIDNSNGSSSGLTDIDIVGMVVPSQSPPPTGRARTTAQSQPSAVSWPNDDPSFPDRYHWTQEPTLFSAESCSFLPLLVHEPRYLRSRRRKPHRGRLRQGGAAFLTPIVHPASSSHNGYRGTTTTASTTTTSLGGDERVVVQTPNMTSPETSFLLVQHGMAVIT